MVLNKDIAIIEPITLDGSCTITGGVYGNIPGKVQESDPIPGVDVVVEKVPPGNALTSDTTDSAGQY
jgi:NADH:ubiquinone oxidoreductase subunit B-like Fe-S oxidoreductase